MGNIDLESIDLNLLVVFNHLFVERRVSVVAEKLGLTQPAVSNALGRLRTRLGDELFLRTPRGMEPTPYASRLAEPIAYALGTIHSTLNERTEFSPGSSTRRFTLAMTDVGEIYILPELMRRLARIAPGVTISTVRNTKANLRDEMESGQVDLAMGLLPQLKAGFFQRRLFRQHYVCMFRKGHALDKEKISVAEFSRAEHVAVVSEGTGHAQADEYFRRKGIKRKVVLTVPHFVAVGHILSTTEMVATVPERYARQCAKPFGLRYLPHPVSLPDIAINIFWHAKVHKEPGNQWLRTVVFDAFSE